MKKSPQYSGSLVFQNRITGEVLSSVPFPDHENPEILPPPETAIWHYLGFDYFRELLRNRALCLTRLDKQSDKFDGMYTQANANRMTPEVTKLLANVGLVEPPDWQQLQNTNRILRERSYVHCWSVRGKDSAWMWLTFLGENVRSVALRSTVGRLSNALRGQPIRMVKVLYYPKDKPRPDSSYTAPFCAKDHDSHSNERELRLLRTLDLSEPHSDYVMVPIDPNAALSKIIVHPSSPSEFCAEVREEVRNHRVHVHVAKSRLQSYDLSAVSSHQRGQR